MGGRVVGWGDYAGYKDGPETGSTGDGEANAGNRSGREWLGLSL